ncbi:DUF2272 domain-containing protein [Sabulicella rubraurantiaca]|uniref:DUF2272 domain-containing protein n=1 Tax=Sabulicella rubraurantiaca TaxID=2811429 RepID=UPI001A95BBFF|nr:DUF2272 domain-containing protein [Sabulicella rubraurantiaca]
MPFADDLVWVTVAEFEKYGRMTEDEDVFSDRIGQYWAIRGKPYTGKDSGLDWSGAFISMMVRLADPDADFQFSGSSSFHAEPSAQTTQNEEGGWFRGYRPAEITIEPGDLLFMNEEGQPQLLYEDAAAERHDFPYRESHGDIVVAVDPTGIHTIGGNVKDRIGQKRFIFDENKDLVNVADQNQKVFVVVRRI